MNIRKSNINPQKPAFSGHNKKLDKAGYETHNFFYLYDKDKYNCEVELYNLNKDKNGNFSTGKVAAVLPLENGRVEADVSSIGKMVSDIGFAYRFKLTDKNTGEESYAFDNGTVIGIFDRDNTDNKFNVVLNNRATINKNGAMQLIMPDEYFPGYKLIDGKPSFDEALRGKALASVRNHANKLGGNFAGIIQRLPDLEKEGVKRVVGTPFTKDTISSHLYWTENAYRVAPNLGTEDDFRVLQEELCKHGINWIADAALVNEGFGGIHISELLRKGDEANAKNMFRTDEKISLGILPDEGDYTRMKLINAPFVINADGSYQEDNPQYDSSKPTYVQFYDDRLASEEQKTSQDIARGTTYDNKNTDNIYDITKHDDAVYPFPVEVNPDELTRNVKNIYGKKDKVDFSDVDTIMAATNFSNFNIVNKSAAGGLEVWDGNVDIAKLNFYRAENDDSRFANLPEYQKREAMKKFDRGALAVRDYAVNSGKYWTKFAADAQLNYVSKLFDTDEKISTPKGYMNYINSLVRDGKLPASTLEVVDEEVVQNVLSGDYYSRKIDGSEDLSASEYILKEAMDVPLETIPVATNLLGVLTSPYIAKKANVPEELGVSRFDLHSQDNPNLPSEYETVYSEMEDIYKEDMGTILNEVLSEMTEKISENGEVTPYGKFVLSEIVPDLTKYLFVKALAPQAEISVGKDGKFDFTKVDENAITIQSLGIPYSGKTLEEEAQIVVDKLKDGLAKIPQEEINGLKSKVTARFENRDENSYRLAEMILDRTESGLGWRIDAAKDIASIDSVRADVDSMTNAWNNVIDFWKIYNQAVLSENPHAYTTAEITDLYDLFVNEDRTVFKNDADAERKFLEETGITAVANYNYFFSLLPDLFAPLKLEDFDDNNGWQAGQEKNFKLLTKMNEGWGGVNPGFLFQSPDDGVVNSYTFVGNHDKPRMLHLLSLDRDLFNSDFSSNEHKKIAAGVLGKSVNSINYDEQNPMAIAMGARLNEAFETVVTNKDELAALKNAVKNLASGVHKGKKFDAAAFGTRPLEIAIKTVLDEVEYNGGTIADSQTLKNKVLENILEPAFDRFRSIYKLLVTLPGSPTDFAGDRVGVTGFETKAKNYHQQNRNVINWEWLDNDDFKFVQDFYKDMNNIANLRTKKELSALNDGSTITLNVGDGSINEKTQGLIRYNDNGSVVLALLNSVGASNNFRNKMDRVYGNKSEPDESGRKPNVKDLKPLNIISDSNKKLYLGKGAGNITNGLKHGLKVGDVFYNARFIDGIKDKEQYVVSYDRAKGEYYLEKKVKVNGVYQTADIVIAPEDLNTLILYKA